MRVCFLFGLYTKIKWFFPIRPNEPIYSNPITRTIPQKHIIYCLGGVPQNQHVVIKHLSMVIEKKTLNKSWKNTTQTILPFDFRSMVIEPGSIHYVQIFYVICFNFIFFRNASFFTIIDDFSLRFLNLEKVNFFAKINYYFLEKIARSTNILPVSWHKFQLLT